MAPEALLTVVNRTLTANIKRLGEDKYMTLQAFRSDGAGAFSVAGLHQDLVVYRAAERRVETIRTRGAWLGILADVAGALPPSRLELAAGDVLLLFTDGVTEATKDGAMLDVGWLAKFLEENGDASAQEILDRLSAKLAGYERHDDVSVVVIRQLEPALGGLPE